MLARQLHPFVAISIVLGASLFAVAGCSSSSVSTTSVTHPTMVEVSPESFLGDVACTTSGPGLKRYVATLFDTNYVPVGGGGGSGGSGGAGGSPAATGNGGNATQPDFALPSSTPTPCRASVGFAYVAPAHRYRVEVEGYDTDDVRPRALGSRLMVDADGELVEPKWRAVCDKPIIAVENIIIGGGLCSKTFEVTDPTASASLTVSLTSLLGSLKCGSEPGEVDHFDVSVLNEGSEEAVAIPCADGARAIFDDLAAGKSMSVYVAAFSAGSTQAFAGANCTGRTIPGANVDATCDALSQTGTLRVDLAAALSQLDLSCKGSDLKLEVSAPGDESPRVVTPPACLQPFDHGFAPGPAALTVTAKRVPSGEELGTLTCHGDITPGQFVLAECEPNSAG